MVKINQVLLSAGIHGNEKTGIYLIKKFQQEQRLITKESFNTETLLINHQAIELNQRYCEIDLNRCFDLKTINSNPRLHEQKLAQKIYQQINKSGIDLVLDFHTSTANMGLTLMLSSDRPFNLQLAAYLVSINPLIKIVRSHKQRHQNRFRHLFPFGFTVEMGAIAPNVIDSKWFDLAEKLVFQTLDYIEQNNQGHQPASPQTLTLYSMLEPIHFPTDDRGDITAMVSPQLHGHDYSALQPKAAIFNKFDGTEIPYQGSQTVYPIFINEAAYWEHKIAMYFTTEETIVIPTGQTLN